MKLFITQGRYTSCQESNTGYGQQVLPMLTILRFTGLSREEDLMRNFLIRTWQCPNICASNLEQYSLQPLCRGIGTEPPCLSALTWASSRVSRHTSGRQLCNIITRHKRWEPESCELHCCCSRTRWEKTLKVSSLLLLSSWRNYKNLWNLLNIIKK
jgi:hypothetical protein